MWKTHSAKTRISHYYTQYFLSEQNMPWIFNTRDCSKETNKQYTRAFDVPTKKAEPESKVAAVFFLGSYFVNLFIFC